MIRLECDYAEGAHERVLRRLFETNLEQTPGYGEDAVGLFIRTIAMKIV